MQASALQRHVYQSLTHTDYLSIGSQPTRLLGATPEIIAATSTQDVLPCTNAFHSVASLAGFAVVVSCLCLRIAIGCQAAVDPAMPLFLDELPPHSLYLPEPHGALSAGGASRAHRESVDSCSACVTTLNDRLMAAL